jgi:hypothetical protein
MKRIEPIMFLFAGICFIFSCSDSNWNCIDGNGHPVTIRRVVGEFTNVASYGDFIVNVSIGATTSVFVEADDNLIPYIETYIQGNTLIIETQDNHCIQSRSPIYVNIVTPSVNQLTMLGSGVINCADVNTNELKLVLSGSGNIQSTNTTAEFIEATLSGSGEILLSGTANITTFTISGSGNISALNLEQNKCFATISGSGIMYVYVNNLIDVLISGSGNLVYKGNPEIDSKITGSGRVIKY